MSKQYRALVGLAYKPKPDAEEQRVNAGDDCSDIPAADIPALLSNVPPSIEEYGLSARPAASTTTRTRPAPAPEPMPEPAQESE